MDLRDVKALTARGEGRRVEFKEAARDFDGEWAIVTFARVPTLQPAELTDKSQTEPLAKRKVGKDG